MLKVKYLILNYFLLILQNLYKTISGNIKKIPKISKAFLTKYFKLVS